MAERFNAMLDALARSNGALAASLERQRRLVADASHELRTPVTSLRTNLEVLRASAAELPEADRRALLDDLEAQAEELGVLVGDLMELAREGDAAASAAAQDDVRLDEVVAEAPGPRAAPPPARDLDDQPGARARARRARAPGRAVNNLLDNAATHGGGEVEVVVRGGELRVRDHGPGSPPTSCRSSSTGSGAARAPAAGREPASGWRSSSRSPWPPVAASRPGTPRAAGSRSCSGSRARRRARCGRRPAPGPRRPCPRPRDAPAPGGIHGG